MKKIFLSVFILIIAFGVAYSAVDEFLGVSTVDEYLGISTSDEMLGQPVAAGPATIDYITIHARAQELTSGEECFQLCVFTEGLAAACGTTKTLTTSWADYSSQIDVNPDDSQAWEETDLDGMYLRPVATGPTYEVQVTQYYLTVTWTDESIDTYYPNGDDSDGSWAASGAGDLYVEVDDPSASPDDSSTYIYTDAYTAALMTMEDP